ncbi:MAG TPA: hypothetical protein VEX88_04130 [Glaciibacter sp.]|nr:hypothetical protein [Glaciibacter sp.]
MRKSLAVGTTIVVGIVVVAVPISIFSARDAQVTSEMVESADKLEIPAEWRLVKEIIRPERLVCIDTNPCPSMSRRWETGAELGVADLQQVVEPTDLDWVIDGDCTRSPTGGGLAFVCDGRARSSDYRWAVRVFSPGAGESHQVVLEVRPLHPRVTLGSLRSSQSRG